MDILCPFQGLLLFTQALHNRVGAEKRGGGEVVALTGFINNPLRETERVGKEGTLDVGGCSRQLLKPYTTHKHNTHKGDGW